jgi:site-specific recombinase
MIMRPQYTAKHKIGGTGQIHVAKNATAVVDVVRSIALAALGNATAAISSVLPVGYWIRAFLNLSTTTNKPSAPSAAATNIPIKLRNGKKSSHAMKT